MNLELKSKFLITLITLIFTTASFSCEETVVEEKLDTLKNSEFTFHQDVNKIYFAIYAEKMLNGIQLDSVFIEWFGANLNNVKDVLILNDEGLDGDIITNDNIHSIKISNDSTAILNFIEDDSGYVYLNFNATYGSELVVIQDSMKIGNIIPRIISINAPDTIVRPSDATILLETISAEVFDADGLETIKWVGFTSFHNEGDSLMNSGGYIYLYDDGSEVVLYEPNITSGDENEDDGIFSFRIPIYGAGFSEPSLQTKTGSFIWRFSAQDNLNEYTNIVEHEIIIQ